MYKFIIIDNSNIFANFIPNLLNHDIFVYLLKDKICQELTNKHWILNGLI